MASKLSLLSDEEMESVAAFDITQTLDLHDPRFGSTGSMQFQCPTCGMHEDACIGHHALLRLPYSIFHPLVYKEAQNIINSTCIKCKGKRGQGNRCQNCAEIIPKDYEINTFKKQQRKTIRSLAKNNTCITCKCKLEHGNWCPDCEETVAAPLRAYEKHKNKNDNYHAAVRSKVDHENMYIFPWDVASIMPKGYVISSILVPPVHLRTPKDIEWSSDIQRLYEELVKNLKASASAYVISDLYSKIIGASSSTGIIGSMSKKDGVFRKMMLGKRVEQSARSVITPDPCIAIDEVAVPKMIIDKVRLPVVATVYNKNLLKKLAKEGVLWTKDVQAMPRHVVCGMEFLRMPEDGDMVLLNRQPSLSRESIMCLKVVIRQDDYKTIGINPQVVAPFNADFDGDEMNIFFFDNSYKAEMKELCTNFQDVVVPVQDVVAGCYMMSKDDETVDDEVWDRCMMHCQEVWDRCMMHCQESSFADARPKTPRALLDACLPGHNTEQLTKKRLTEIVRKSDIKILEILQHVVLTWLECKGLTVPISSVACTYRPSTKDATVDPDYFREMCINTAKKKLAGSQIIDIVESGAKGSITHVSNMAVSLGQQYILGKPGVFCENSYSSGLTPQEFFGHQMAAREGVVSTGVNTASTGYLNRRVCTILADVYTDLNDAIGDKYCISTFPPYNA